MKEDFKGNVDGTFYIKREDKKVMYRQDMAER